MAIDLFNEFATDTAAEEKGVWCPYAEGVEFLIARSTNKHYQRALTKAYEKNKRVLDGKGDASENMSEEIMIGVTARTILLGWKGVVWKGEELEYSLENARMLLAVRDFRRWVMARAEDVDSYKVAKDEEDEVK